MQTQEVELASDKDCLESFKNTSDRNKHIPMKFNRSVGIHLFCIKLNLQQV